MQSTTQELPDCRSACRQPVFKFPDINCLKFFWFQHDLKTLRTLSIFSHDNLPLSSFIRYFRFLLARRVLFQAAAM
tara:strand:- start:187 stop:414 length:228 start_codon:yes stop_codon:yes gene_type:complete